MTEPQPILCKPTRWFYLRAWAILLVLAVFSVLFYLDGSTGYRRKNETYFLHAAFQQASNDFTRLNQGGKLDAATWREHAAASHVDLGDNPGLLPAGLVQPMPWPDLLHDYERMKSLQWQQLWLEYSAARGMDADPPEKPFDARKIREQWIVLWICLGLAALTLFFLLRTSRRSLHADHEAFTSASGRRIPYCEIHTLDLRKWKNKGLAYIHHEGAAGKGRARIDGLTYGGFDKEQGEPAEQLMQRLLSHFNGQLIEWVDPAETSAIARAPEQGSGKPE